MARDAAIDLPMTLTDPRPTRRIAWFADLETLVGRLDLLSELHDQIGLTTLVPESHLSHTSGFAASPEIAASSPFRDWKTRPGLRDHRRVFGVDEPAMAVLPGIVGGVDDASLLAVIDECRRLGIEIWGHAGLWSYGGEVFPELAAVDLFGRPLLPDSLPWGTMFCPSKPVLNDWVARSLADAAARYDLDGWFVDHARHTSPGHGPTLMACGCADCAAAAGEHGVDLGTCRDDLVALLHDLRQAGPERLVALAEGGPTAVLGWLEARPGVLAWFEVRARILADRFATLAAAVAAASARRVEFGSDVFPPGVALLGGHVYGHWATGATYLTGGFGPKIGWPSVGRVTVTSLAPWLRALVPGLPDAGALRIVAALVGADPSPGPDGDLEALLREIARIAPARRNLPVYPPVAATWDAAQLGNICDAIVDAGLDGAMIAGLEQTSEAQRRVIRSRLSARLT